MSGGHGGGGVGSSGFFNSCTWCQIGIIAGLTILGGAVVVLGILTGGLAAPAMLAGMAATLGVTSNVLMVLMGMILAGVTVSISNLPRMICKAWNKC